MLSQSHTTTVGNEFHMLLRELMRLQWSCIRYHPDVSTFLAATWGAAIEPQAHNWEEPSVGSRVGLITFKILKGNWCTRQISCGCCGKEGGVIAYASTIVNSNVGGKFSALLILV